MVTAQSAGNITFNREIHGYNFENTFKNVLPSDFRTEVICGGMQKYA